MIYTQGHISDSKFSARQWAKCVAFYRVTVIGTLLLDIVNVTFFLDNEAFEGITAVAELWLETTKLDVC